MRISFFAILALVVHNVRSQDVLILGSDTIAIPGHYYSLKEFPENPGLLVIVDPYGTDSLLEFPHRFPNDKKLQVKKHIQGHLTEDLESGAMSYTKGEQLDSVLWVSHFLGTKSTTELLTMLEQDNSIVPFNSALKECDLECLFLTDSLLSIDFKPNSFHELVSIVTRLKSGDYFGIMSIGCPNNDGRRMRGRWDLLVNGITWRVE